MNDIDYTEDMDDGPTWDEWVTSLGPATRAAIENVKAASRPKRKASDSRRAIPDDAFLSLRETARLLRVSQGKVLAWINRGKIQALDIGRAGRPAYRIDRVALAKSLEVVPQASKARRSPRPKPGFIERY